jgi:hypothetical protein
VQISPECWDTPPFVRANYRLSWAWAATFALMAAADAVNLFLHIGGPNLVAGLGLAALAGALIYTWRFGVQIGRRFGKTPH